LPLTFKILGSGAGPGTPSFFCDCIGCREARENPACARTRSGAILATRQSNILIDTPPDLRAQLVRERISSVDAVFLTHWHYDHFGGLGELEYYVKLERKEPLTLYLPPSAEAQFRTAFPDLQEIFRVVTWTFNQKYCFEDVSITPLAANHGVETAGFLIESTGKRLAYFPDTAGLPPQTARLVEAVDWLICDATFCGENWFPAVHMSVEQAIDLGRQVQARHTVLTHLSIHYSRPMTCRELEEVVSRYPGVLVAYDSLVFNLS
jgi:phosphoribosyl 1,2-cyclic phosphate phosphodiesterase